MIRHRQWSYAIDDTAINEDIFINPDLHSPVEAILISRGGNLGVAIETLPRRGGDHTLAEILQNASWPNMPSLGCLSEEAEQQLHALGVSNQGTYIIWGGGKLDAETRQATVQYFQQFLGLIRTSPLISENFEVREAMIEAMKKELASLRHLVSPSADILPIQTQR
jgi:hypothetical protein